jgi:hypothetical protein
MWLGKRSQSFIHDAPDENKYVYHYDVASAVDTYVYMLGEDGIWANHPVRGPPSISVCWLTVAL